MDDSLTDEKLVLELKAQLDRFVHQAYSLRKDERDRLEQSASLVGENPTKSGKNVPAVKSFVNISHFTFGTSGATHVSSGIDQGVVHGW